MTDRDKVDSFFVEYVFHLKMSGINIGGSNKHAIIEIFYQMASLSRAPRKVLARLTADRPVFLCIFSNQYKTFVAQCENYQF